MDKTMTLTEEEAAGSKVPENESVAMQPDDEEMEEITGVPPSTAAEADQSEKELPERPLSDSAHEGEENRCTVCGFSAKQPRSLKIHYARKHGKNNNKTTKPHEKNQNVQGQSLAESPPEAALKSEKRDGKRNKMQDPNELKEATSNAVNSSNKKPKISDEHETDQDEPVFVKERRASKRTPKPKIIYSCNYCGLEFRDKSPLDVHIKRSHTKDLPFTREYFILFHYFYVSNILFNVNIVSIFILNSRFKSFKS